MTTIIMLISLPIGIYILFQEKEQMRKYQAVFDDFYDKLQIDTSVLKEEKLQLLQDMFYSRMLEHPRLADARVREVLAFAWWHRQDDG